MNLSSSTPVGIVCVPRRPYSHCKALSVAFGDRDDTVGTQQHVALEALHLARLLAPDRPHPALRFVGRVPLVDLGLAVVREHDAGNVKLPRQQHGGMHEVDDHDRRPRRQCATHRLRCRRASDPRQLSAAAGRAGSAPSTVSNGPRCSAPVQNSQASAMPVSSSRCARSRSAEPGETSVMWKRPPFIPRKIWPVRIAPPECAGNRKRGETNNRRGRSSVGCGPASRPDFTSTPPNTVRRSASAQQCRPDR